MDINEFLQPREPKAPAVPVEPIETEAEDEEINPEELQIQQAVVESLAADKAVQDERINALQQEIAELRKANNALKSEISTLGDKIKEQSEALAKVGDVLSANAEDNNISTKVALLERNPELDDRFIGETRDTVLEAVKEARDAAEKEGRLRRAQLLEGVLVVNEPVGNLLKKRVALEKFFAENGNILSGPVIAKLQEVGISHKNGEEYLLPGEILKRMY